MTHILVLIRHAKSDWSTGEDDHDRPIGARGQFQAPTTGRWLARNIAEIDLAVVSTARRAAETWELVSGEFLEQPPVRHDQDAYTFDAAELLTLVRGLPPQARSVVLVGHNPALEGLIEMLTGEYLPMSTSSVAVIRVSGWAQAGKGTGRLLGGGRPADGPVSMSS